MGTRRVDGCTISAQSTIQNVGIAERGGQNMGKLAHWRGRFSHLSEELWGMESGMCVSQVYFISSAMYCITHYGLSLFYSHQSTGYWVPLGPQSTCGLCHVGPKSENGKQVLQLILYSISLQSNMNREFQVMAYTTIPIPMLVFLVAARYVSFTITSQH